MVTVTKVSALNDRANIAPRNVVPRKSNTSGTSASTDTSPPSSPCTRKSNPTASTASSSIAPRKYGSVLPPMMSNRDTGETNISSPRRLIRSERMVLP
jgi:hypothetical protein